MPKREQTPKIEVRGQGVSGHSLEDIERRAKELALIDGRSAATDEDRARARDEFADRNLPDVMNEDADSMQSMSRDPSDPVADRGHQAPTFGGDDEDTWLQSLAVEGVEEAQHDQMVASRENIDEPMRSLPKKKKDA